MKLIKTATAVAIGVLFTSAAFAQAPAVWDQRDARQEHRIEQGVRSGQITQREAAQLQRGEARIDRMQDRALRDGRVTAQERNRIDHAQDRQSREIYRQSHDAQTANRGHGSPHNMHGQSHREANQQRYPQYGQSHRDVYQQRHTSQGGRPGDFGNHGAGRMERGNFGAAHGETRGGADSRATRTDARTVAPVQSGRNETRSGADARTSRNEARPIQTAQNSPGRQTQQAGSEPRSRR